MLHASDWYSAWYASLEFHRIDFDCGGIEIYRPEDLPNAQRGYAFSADGESLVGTEPGDWRPEWIVIGYDTGVGDPIFTSQSQPQPIFTAMHGQGSWEPTVVAPSIESFGYCLTAFRKFAQGRDCPVELERNPPSENEQRLFVEIIKQLTACEKEAWTFWALQIGIDPESYMTG